MGVSNFPYGISTEGNSIAVGTASITGVGTVTTGLTTATGLNVSYMGSAGTASAAVLTVSGTVHSGGDVIIRTVRADSTAGTIAANVAWVAWGTRP